MLPDVNADGATRPEHGARLDRVGMSGIESPVCVELGGRRWTVPARVDAFVDLVDPGARGIHMSRLFLALHERLPNHRLTPALLRDALTAFVGSQDGRSSAGHVRIAFDLLVERTSLVSGYSGWRTYPVVVEGTVRSKGQFSARQTVRVTYSSTCPCSASLARQLTRDAFRAAFPDGDPSREAVLDWLGTEASLGGAPHAQRSHATVTTELASRALEWPFLEHVDIVERAVKTPVQAAVKRVDEQAFARLNAQNLMFCEDAARRIRNALDDAADVVDYRVETRHFESLHPHDAVTVVVKGVPDGLRP